MGPNAEMLVERLEALQAQSGAPGDEELAGVSMGQIFALAKELIDMPPAEIERLLESPVHKVRVGALSIMDKQARRKRTPETRRKELYDRSDDMWERRTAIVSTLYFVRNGDVEDTFAIAELLVDEPEDLVRKATGGLLREAGKKDRDKLVAFLDRHAARMPRVMLSYALEHFDKAEKERYRSL